MTRPTDQQDRTVHAGIPGGGAIVRYDRAGAWFLEWPPDTGKKRTRISVLQAAILAEGNESKDGAYIAFGRAGGARFDSMIRSIRSSLLMFDEDARDTARAELFGPKIAYLLED